MKGRGDLKRAPDTKSPDRTGCFTANLVTIKQNHARITVALTDGRKVVGVAGGDAEDLASPKNAAQVEAKFRSLCESRLGTPGTDAILARLWALETLKDIGDIPPLLVIE